MAPATWAVRCGAVVLLSGYLESFIRDCMRAFIADVNALGHPLTKLPEGMKHTHFDVGARVLRWQLKLDKRAGNTARCEDLSTRLASVSAPTGYTLVWEAFANTEANPGPEVIAEVLGSVGVKNGWEKLKAATPTGLVDLKTFMTSFILMRNECAHSGNITSPPSASDLLDYGQNLAGLGTAMVSVLRERLTELAAL
ncbi:MAG: HEPN domain-containing protein [Candidatus Dormibacteria bacterium]